MWLKLKFYECKIHLFVYVCVYVYSFYLSLMKTTKQNLQLISKRWIEVDQSTWLMKISTLQRQAARKKKEKMKYKIARKQNKVSFVSP